MSSQPCRPSFVPEPASCARAPSLSIRSIGCAAAAAFSGSRTPNGERQHPRLAAAGPRQSEPVPAGMPCLRRLGASERWRRPALRCRRQDASGRPRPSRSETDESVVDFEDPDGKRHGRPAAAQDHRAESGDREDDRSRLGLSDSGRGSRRAGCRERGRRRDRRRRCHGNDRGPGASPSRRLRRFRLSAATGTGVTASRRPSGTPSGRVRAGDRERVAVPLVRPVRAIWVLAPVAVMPPGDEVTV